MVRNFSARSAKKLKKLFQGKNASMRLKTGKFLKRMKIFPRRKRESLSVKKGFLKHLRRFQNFSFTPAKNWMPVTG